MRQRLTEVASDAEAVFISRENRFAVKVRGSFGVELAHLHDPGRLSEILREGTPLLLKRADSPRRKTRWDVIAGWCEGQWVFIHSGYHSLFARVMLEGGCLPLSVVSLKAEVRRNASRIDFLAETHSGPVWIEVKGCTLAKDGVALFPDAPTSRGTRHIRELADIVRRGGSAAVLFLVFRGDARVFRPNADTDPAFARALTEAVTLGVEPFAPVLSYDGRWVYFERFIPCGV